MKIVFRVDSSYQIGSGHLMRCITLADKLRQESVEIRFICRDHEGDMSHIARNSGYHVDLLSADAIKIDTETVNLHKRWLGATLDEDADQTLDSLRRFGPVDWMVVDHYAIDSSWEKRMRPAAENIFVIDDLADRFHDCDVLLDQNLIDSPEERYRNFVASDCQLLCGPKYALLRPQFVEKKYQKRQRNGSVRHLLVFFGGVDATGETLKTCRAIQSLGNGSITADVIAGPSNPQQTEIREFCELHSQLTYHAQVANMAELMVKSDLAIGAGGTTTWERCAAGLPSIVISVAKNQVAIASEVGRFGLGKYLGSAETVTETNIKDAIEQLRENPEMLSAMRQKELDLVDGNGAERVGRTLLDWQRETA